MKGLHRSTVCRSLRLLVDKGLLQAKKRSRPGLPEHGHGWRLSNWYTLGRTAYAIWGRWCREIAKQMSGFRMDQFEEAYRRIHAWVTAFSSPAVLFLRQLWAGPSVPAPGSPAAAGPPAPPAAGPDPAHSLAEIERLIQEAREAREEIKRMRPSPDPRTPTPPKPEDGS